MVRKIPGGQRIKIFYLIILPTFLFIQACSQSADESAKPAAADPDEPALSTAPPTEATQSPTYPQRVFFGDTHLHTDLSLDAGAFANRQGWMPPIGLPEVMKTVQIRSSCGTAWQTMNPQPAVKCWPFRIMVI